jgi:hypothetical protein
MFIIFWTFDSAISDGVNGHFEIKGGLFKSQNLRLKSHCGESSKSSGDSRLDSPVQNGGFWREYLSGFSLTITRFIPLCVCIL